MAPSPPLRAATYEPGLGVTAGSITTRSPSLKSGSIELPFRVRAKVSLECFRSEKATPQHHLAGRRYMFRAIGQPVCTKSAGFVALQARLGPCLVLRRRSFPRGSGVGPSSRVVFGERFDFPCCGVAHHARFTRLGVGRGIEPLTDLCGSFADDPERFAWLPASLMRMLSLCRRVASTGCIGLVFSGWLTSTMCRG